MKVLLSSLLITLLLTVAFLTYQLVSRIQSNLGMHNLMSGLVASPSSVNSGLDPSTELFIARALEWDKNNSTVWRALGFVEWYRGNDEQAFKVWRQLGLKVEDYVAYGTVRLIGFGDREEALRWYTLAKQLDPTHKGLWRHVGRICQNQFEPGICDDYLHYNDNNWVVDTNFVFDQAAWRLNRISEIVHSTGYCPGRVDKKCASVVTSDVPDYSSTWYQCLNLDAGKEYVFSSWIRIEAPTSTTWRPLYFQGNVDGTPKGSWSGNQQGSSDWTYWERIFAAPQFDDNWACFHPVRIGANAKAWFYDARLEVIEESTNAGKE